MSNRSKFWRQHLFTLVAVGCVQFIVLTAVAMPFYPGGTFTDPTASGYSFFTNFFSELGLTRTRAGQPNTVSAVLFATALTVAGISLALFFVGFAQFFWRTTLGQVLSGCGSTFGIVCAICFVGVAFTPADLYGGAHRRFVLWAFSAFPAAVLPYAIAIFCERRYPKRYALIFVAFGVLLVFYVLLLRKGPDLHTAAGLTIQATGQKTIVYASIVSILMQALGAKKVGRTLKLAPS